MKLTKDAKLFNAAGETVGNLNRFVIDPRSRRITHIVFERGMLSKTEHVIPMELVDHVDSDGIHMIETQAKPEELPLFEEDQYIITNEHALIDEGVVSDTAVSTYFYYPAVPSSTNAALHTYHQTDEKPRLVRGSVPIEGNNMPPVVNNPERNIPEGSVALKEGAKVFSSDQKHVGDVEKVIIDPNSETATHLLITKGLLNREKKLIPLSWVAQIQDEEVALAIGEDFIDHLPDYKED